MGVSELHADHVRAQVCLRVCGVEFVQSFICDEIDEIWQIFVYDSHRIILVVHSLRQQIGTNGIKPDPLAYKIPSEAGCSIEYIYFHVVIL